VASLNQPLRMMVPCNQEYKSSNNHNKTKNISIGNVKMIVGKMCQRRGGVIAVTTSRQLLSLFIRRGML
jgi:CheY-specific phosphatase CheX